MKTGNIVKQLSCVLMASSTMDKKGHGREADVHDLVHLCSNTQGQGLSTLHAAKRSADEKQL